MGMNGKSDALRQRGKNLRQCGIAIQLTHFGEEQHRVLLSIALVVLPLLRMACRVPPKILHQVVRYVDLAPRVELEFQVLWLKGKANLLSRHHIRPPARIKEILFWKSATLD